MMTASEIRGKIIETVTLNGGHLASSLGAVELAMALAKVFEPEKDRIVWDVGHQAYAWKILTGREENFSTLRQMGGISPFINPQESSADAAVSGHAGSAFSVAEGLAAARDARGGDEHVVAVIGDASMANGMSFEALNNCESATKKLIVVLNDNEMSISGPVGDLSKQFGRMLTNARYNRVKLAAEEIGHRAGFGFLQKLYHTVESRIKGLFLGSRYFEQFGLRYIGPVDGHNLDELESALTVARNDKRSVIVHVATKKGKGYAPAEENPTKYHGVSPAGTISSGKSWSAAFGEIVTELAANDSRVMALTAGMKDGTGLVGFAERFPERFRDVGIAEEHMVGYAAGLAAGGMRPIVAVYSTFLQRAVDQIMHDVAIANLPVIFAVDRAGVVGADGVTHQGLYDIAMLRCLPNVTICEPKDADDLGELLKEAISRGGPTVIRYPRGTVGKIDDNLPPIGEKRMSIWATGDYLNKAYEVAKKLGNAEVVHARYLKPFDAEKLAQERAAGLKIVSLENGSIAGGFGEAIGADMKFGWPDEFIPHGSVDELERRYGLDVESMVEKLKKEM